MTKLIDFRDGLSMLSPNGCAEAMGTALFDANPGEDIGLKDLAGKVKLVRGRIMIVKLPSIRRGGSEQWILHSS